MSASRRILILYTELAGYTIASLNALAAEQVDVHLVRWPVNAEAPFDFSFGDKLHVYDRKQYDDKGLLKLAEEVKPDLILCSGWNDKGYLAVCKIWRNFVPVVLAMDNKWSGTARQQLARLVSRFTILRYFSHCWVPGPDQQVYAEKLGFGTDKIKTGFYTCDTDRFSVVYKETSAAKTQHFPHVFIYAGRYYEFKGVKEMWSAFMRLKQEAANDWKLVCLGVGDVTPPEHPDITHEGFVQPEKLSEVMARTGVFILPSRFEPWAVVVQEFAAAGFPVLLSDAVGASRFFLEEGRNGFRFRNNDEEALLAAMKHITELSDQQLVQMGKRSHELGMRVTPRSWAKTLLSFLT